jgi:hypothetical protein
MSNLSGGARRLASVQQERKQMPQGVAPIWLRPADVVEVVTGAASDGNDLLTVSYSGTEQQCAYLSSYTPTLGDVVAVVISANGNLLCIGRIVGTP